MKTTKKSRKISIQKNKKHISDNEQSIVTLLNAVSDFALIIDREGIILWANNASVHMFTDKVAYVTGKNIFELLPSGARTVTRLNFKKAIIDKELIRFEDLRNNKWTEYNLQPVLDEKGDIAKIAVYGKDITERKRTEEALRDSEVRFRKIFEEGRFGMVIANKNFLFIRANAAFCAMVGYTEKELASCTFKDITHPDHLTMDVENVMRVFIGDIPVYKTEKRYIRKDGCIVWGAATITAIRDENGDFLYFLSMIEDITERKRAEMELYESHSLLSHFIKQSPIYAFIKAVKPGESRVIYASENYKDMIGISGSDMAGKTMNELFPPEFAEKINADDWEAVSAGKILNIEETLNDKNYLTIKFPIRQESRNLLAGYTIDITERKRAEEALSASEARFRSIVENIHDGISFTDANCVILYRSPSFQTINGYTSDERLGHKGFELIHPDDLDTIRLTWKELLNHPETTQVAICRTRHKDGSWRYIESTAQNLLANPDINAILQTTRDVTERKRAEDLLRASEERFKHLVESVTDYIYTVKVEEGKAVKITHGPGCIGVTGYTPEEFEADPQLWFNMVYGEDRQYVTEQLEKVLTGENVLPNEHRIIHKNGTIHWVKDIPVLRRDDQGSLIAYDGLISDITERKYAEEEKERLQSQLQQSQKMEALGTFVGGIAHDFNNILNVVIGYTNLLEMELVKDNPLHTFVEQILISSEKAANLTKSLLAFSRKQPVVQKPMNLNNVISGIEKLLRRLIPEDITLNIKLDKNDIIITGDSSQIDQILFNLVTNARDAVPKGGIISIFTKLVRLDSTFTEMLGYGKPGEYALITFSDNGSGMDRITREHIFDPFYTTKEVGKGTGLGMSTVYSIVKQHDGYINVYSEQGSGTAFHIYFPAATTAYIEDNTAPSILKYGKETILIAEDNESVRVLMKVVLTKYGYTVLEAVDGEDAINKFHSHRNIDMVIIDSVMPKKNGREVYDEIIKTNSKIKVLFYSGYTQDILLNKGIREREFDFMSKPLTPNVLLEKVREILDKQ